MPKTNRKTSTYHQRYLYLHMMTPTKTAVLEDTLPLTAPQPKKVLDWRPRGPILVYITAELSTDEHSQLVAEMYESFEEPQEMFRYAPEDFTGATLREVYEHFIRHRDEDLSVDPLLFMVADHAASGRNGILIVCLDASTLREDLKQHFVVGVARVTGGQVGIDIACLTSGATDWLHIKESEDDGPDGWGGHVADNERLYPPEGFP